MEQIDNFMLLMKCCASYRDIAPDDLGNEGLIFQAFVAADNPAHEIKGTSSRRVRIVVVPIELNNERAAMKDFSGSIRTSIQRQSGSQVITAGERSVGGGLA